MATTGVGFRWLDVLEKEFDKAAVELDTSLNELEVEEVDIIYGARQKIATLSSCFAQLTHKALTIFQNSAKLEAEIVDMRAELVQARKASVNGHEAGDGVSTLREGSHARYEAAQFARENAALRETILALHSELFGARLATKYLDKELAGRIQQLQLLGRDMRTDLRDSLWAQVEAEILLQRHKTLVRVCRGLAPCPPRPPRSKSAPLPSRPRTVRVRRSPHLGLGISVTGGREHGVPILISELETGGPAALTGQLYVGDAILAINDLDLTQACHKEAVQALQSVKGDCALCVQFIATDDDDQLSDDNYRFPLYPDDCEAYEPEPNGSGATPTAPRTPEFTRPDSEVQSASECEEEQTRYAEPEYKAQPQPYTDYINNSMNNNISIVELDENSIKIEAVRNRGAYRGPLPASSNDSVGSTPVHLRRTSLKKKRVKPSDWRSKGAYRAVDDDPSSDDTESLPINGHGISTVFDKPKEEPPKIPSKEELSPEIKSVDDKLPTEPSPPLIAIPTVPLPPPQEVVIPPITTIRSKNTAKPNGLDSNLLRNKIFRIGTAKRVLEAAPNLTNGDSNIDRITYPTHLLSGDGDPDFGTPV